MAGNANSGRRPAPTALTVLRGNPSRKRLNEREPVAPPGVVVKPEGLSAGAALVWDELAPICLAMGTLTRADEKPFTTLCELQETFARVVAQKPFIDERLIRLERETAIALRSYYEFFGLTPSSMARIQVPKPAEAPASKWAGVLT